MRFGIIFCHGHAHRPYLNDLPPGLPDNIVWTLIDSDPKTDPDLVADYSQTEQLVEKLGSAQYDYVVDKGCPMHQTRELYKTAFALLKPGGQFIIIQGVKLILSALELTYWRYEAGVPLVNNANDLIQVMNDLGLMPPINIIENIGPSFDELKRKYLSSEISILQLLYLIGSKLATLGPFQRWKIPVINNSLSFIIVYQK